MENGNMGDTELDVTALSDGELARRLRELGANIGPIIDSTRHIYQLKLQHWLKKGNVSGSSSFGELGHASMLLEDVPTDGRSDIKTTADVTNGTSQIVVPDSAPVLKVSAKLKQVTDQDESGMDAKYTPVISGGKGRVVAPLVTSKNDNYSDSKQQTEVPAEAVETRNDDLSFVNQNDVDMVEQLMGKSSHRSTPYPDIKHGEISSDELRNRFLSHNVTPRPALHSYGIDSDFTGRNIMSDQRLSSKSFLTSTPYQKPAYAAKPGFSASHAEQTNVGAGIVRWLAFIAVIVALIFIAVYCNMEPAYTSPA